MTDGDSDPLDELADDEYDEREGDPFAQLDDATDPTDQRDDAPDPADASDSTDGQGADPTDPEQSGRDPFDYLDGTAPGVPDGADDRDVTDRSLADIAEGDGPDVAGGEQVDVAGDPFGDVDVSRGDPFEAAESPFQHVDVEGVDPDEVWERFTEGAESDSEPGVEPPEDDVVVVSKHAFCEGCPHFTPPPEIECTHEGTVIREFVGPDDVRVENCPIVRERRELGEVHD